MLELHLAGFPEITLEEVGGDELSNEYKMVFGVCENDPDRLAQIAIRLYHDQLIRLREIIDDLIAD